MNWILIAWIPDLVRDDGQRAGFWVRQNDEEIFRTLSQDCHAALQPLLKLWLAMRNDENIVA